MVAAVYLLTVVGAVIALAVITRPRPVPAAPAPRVPAHPPAAPADDAEIRLLAVALARLADRLTP